MVGYLESWDCPDSDSISCDLTWSEPDGNWRLDDGRCVSRPSSGHHSARADHDLSTDNHKASADVTWLHWKNVNAGTCVRMDSTTSPDWYRGTYHPDSQEDRLHKRVSGSVSTLSTQSHSLSQATYLVETDIDGSTLSVVVGGDAALSVSDTGITGNTRCGIGGFNDGQVKPFEFDNWVTRDLSTIIVGQASESNVATGLTVVGGKFNVGQATSSDEARAVTPIVPTVYDFETGDTSRWDTVNNLSVVTDRVNTGTYAGYSQSGSTSGNVLADVIPNGMAGGNQISKFEYYFQETSSGSHGAGVRLVNSNGNVEVGVSTDNPAWWTDDGLGQTEIYGGDGYDRWIRFTLTFRWPEEEYDYDFEDLSSGTQRTGTRSLKKAVDIEKIRLDNYHNGTWLASGNSVEQWWDDTTVHAVGSTAKLVGLAVETDLAHPVSTGALTVAVGQALESDTSQPLTSSKLQGVGQAVESDLAQQTTPSRTHQVGQASESDAALAVAGAKTATVGQAIESDVAFAVTFSGSVKIGQALESDVAHPASVVVATLVGQASETDASLTVSSAKTVAVGQATSSEVVHGVTALRSLAIGQSVESDQSRPLGVLRTLTAGQAQELATAQAVSDLLAKTITAGQSLESDLSLSVSATTTATLLVTPSRRILVVDPEDRTLAVTADERVFDVEG